MLYLPYLHNSKFGEFIRVIVGEPGERGKANGEISSHNPENM